jgi:hypothetical protein
MKMKFNQEDKEMIIKNRGNYVGIPVEFTTKGYNSKGSEREKDEYEN